MFDERALAARALLDGHAAAGRGNTHFLTLDGHALVLRHYRRGGLVRHVSERSYVWTGIARTRAVREFELLRTLEREGLPAPRPFACAVTRHGLLWEGSLVTRRLPGTTLAERLDAIAAGGGGASAGMPWAAIGRCIARFHAHGVRHADLNAHNVMLDGDDVSLIDFDRADRVGRGGHAGPVPPSPRPARWQRANVRRLRRSLARLAARAGRSPDAPGFATLERAWRDELRRAARAP